MSQDVPDCMSGAVFECVSARKSVLVRMLADVEEDRHFPNKFCQGIRHRECQNPPAPPGARIRQVFERFDKDGGGSLDRQEMQWLGWAWLGKPPEKEVSIRAI